MLKQKLPELCFLANFLAQVNANVAFARNIETLFDNPQISKNLIQHFTHLLSERSLFYPVATLPNNTIC